MYLNSWKDGGIEGMKSDFSIDDKALEGVEVLLASYDSGLYSGDAFVLFRKDGQLFEVNGSHCSCYGLERCWSPEAVTLPELKHRLEKGELGKDTCYGSQFAVELANVLASLENGTRDRDASE